MISLGYQVHNYKMLGVCPVGHAGRRLHGATKTMVAQLASPVDVHWSTSGDVDADGDLGRRRNPVRPCCGRHASWRCCSSISRIRGLPIQMVIGAIFVVCILVFRQECCGRDQPADGTLRPRSAVGCRWAAVTGGAGDTAQHFPNISKTYSSVAAPLCANYCSPSTEDIPWIKPSDCKLPSAPIMSAPSCVRRNCAAPSKRLASTAVMRSPDARKPPQHKALEDKYIKRHCEVSGGHRPRCRHRWRIPPRVLSPLSGKDRGRHGRTAEA